MIRNIDKAKIKRSAKVKQLITQKGALSRASLDFAIDRGQKVTW
jgi:hypothetical protein